MPDSLEIAVERRRPSFGERFSDRLQRTKLTLGQHMLLLSTVFFVVAISMLTVLTDQLERYAVKDLARNDARETSRLMFLGLYSAMKRGWDKDDIGKIVDEFEEIKRGLAIELVRGELVVSQFGDTPAAWERRQHDLDVRKVLASGKEHFEIDESMIRYIYPVIVRPECMGCHASSRPGDVNGVIEIEYPVADVKISLLFAQRSAAFLVAILIASLATVILVQFRFMLARPLQRLVRQISDITETSNLNRTIDSGVSVLEVDYLARHFNTMLGALRDSTGLLDRATTLDALTGLLNRRAFFDRVARCMDGEGQPATCFAIVVIDVDQLHDFNLRHGHHYGDLVLARVAEGIGQYFGSDVVAGRIGGDTFAVLLEETCGDQAEKRSLGLRAFLKNGFMRIEETAPSPTLSFTVASFPENGVHLEEIPSAVEAAKLKARAGGPDQLVRLESSDMHGRLSVAETVNMVRRALDEDGIEVELEPIMTVGTVDVAAYEVLARVRREGRLVPAGEFMEHVERAGLTTSVDFAVINRALSFCRQRPGFDCNLFFNLSPRTLDNDVAMKRIFTIVREHRFAPSRIVFEITEREALSRISRIARLIHQAKKQGYRFALDDFGSGFSSFLYLKYLFVDFVKIDGELVKDIVTNEVELSMIRHINGLVHELGIETIAEYVESEEILSKLMLLGVDFAQGYLFKQKNMLSKPQGRANLAVD